MDYYLLTGISFLGICFFIKVLSGIPYAFAPLFALAYVGLGGYVAAYYMHLEPFLQYSMYAGLVVFLPSLYYCIKKYTPDKASDYAISALHAVAQCFIIWYYYGAQIRYFDEFYWAAYSREIFNTGALFSQNSLLLEAAIPLAHPPLMAILQSFFSTVPWIEASFHEGSIGMAGFTLLLALACCVAAISRRYMPLLPALVLALLVASTARVFGTSFKAGVYVMAYAEYYQAALLSLGIVLVCFMQNSVVRTWALLVTVVLLTLSKATSFLFALAIFSVFAVRVFYTYRQEREQQAVHARQDFYKGLGLCVTMLLLIIVSRYSYVSHLVDKTETHTQHTQQVVKQKASAQSTAPSSAPSAPEKNVSQLTSSAPEKNTQTNLFVKIRDFIYTGSSFEELKDIPWEVVQVWGHAFMVFPYVYSPWLSDAFMSVFFTGWVICLVFLVIVGVGYKCNYIAFKKEHTLILAVLLIGYVAWFALRILIAIQMHSTEEVYRAASYPRYVGAYFAGVMTFMLMAFYTNQEKLFASGKKVLTGVLCLQTGLFLVVIGFSPWAPPRSIPLPAKQERVYEAALMVQEQLPEKARVWIVIPERSKENFVMMRYALLEKYKVIALPWYVSPDAQNVLQVQPLLARAKAKNIDYVVLWGADTDIRYTGNNGAVDLAKHPVVIPIL